MTALGFNISAVRQFIRFTSTRLNLPIFSSGSLCLGSDNFRLSWNRHYWNKRAPRSPPTKPLSFDYSGDLSSSIGIVNYSQPKLGFESLPEYENADENVKKIVSLNFSNKAEMVDKVISDMIEKIKEHPLDFNSTECHIAKDTVLIRNQIQHCLRYRNDKVAKRFLIERIHHRKKTLKQLRRRDIEKFNWLTSELQLELTPDPTPERMIMSKREKREEAARQASAALINRKNEELRKRLAAEKEAFDEYKEAELADIQKSLQELGINQIESLEQTLVALGAGDLVPKPPPKTSRRRRKLAMLFELHSEEKRQKDAEILRAHGFIVPKSLLTPSAKAFPKSSS